MGANLNKNEMSLFIIDKPEWKNGAVAIVSCPALI